MSRKQEIVDLLRGLYDGTLLDRVGDDHFEEFEIIRRQIHQLYNSLAGTNMDTAQDWAKLSTDITNIRDKVQNFESKWTHSAKSGVIRGLEKCLEMSDGMKMSLELVYVHEKVAGKSTNQAGPDPDQHESYTRGIDGLLCKLYAFVV
jgi:hypothetical protein